MELIFVSGPPLSSIEAPQFTSEFSCRWRRNRSKILEPIHLFKPSSQKRLFMQTEEKQIQDFRTNPSFQTKFTKEMEEKQIQDFRTNPSFQTKFRTKFQTSHVMVLNCYSPGE